MACAGWLGSRWGERSPREMSVFLITPHKPHILYTYKMVHEVAFFGQEKVSWVHLVDDFLPLLSVVAGWHIGGWLE